MPLSVAFVILRQAPLQCSTASGGNNPPVLSALARGRVATDPREKIPPKKTLCFMLKM